MNTSEATLEAALERIKSLENEINGLNTALKSLTKSDNINTIFENLLDTLKTILNYDHAFILFEVQKDQYVSYFATQYDFLERIWNGGELFEAIRGGKAKIQDNIFSSSEWLEHEDLKRYVKSALHFPLKGAKHSAIFVCTKNEDNFFNHSHFKIASDFIPFASYAIRMLENNQNLKDEIMERQKIEDQNRRLQAKVIDNAYKEGFAENAISVLHNIGNLMTPLKLKFEEFDGTFPINNIIMVLNKLKEISDAEKKETIINKIIAILEDNNAEFQDLILFGLDQTDKIAITINSQQKYANLKNKLKSRFYFNDTIQDVIKTHQGQLDKFQIKLINQIKGKHQIEIERNGIHHVITNLMTNAIEAINERSKIYGDFKDKFIYISLLKANNEYIYTIKDTGIGVTEEEFRQLFTFGFTTKEEGSGFGLHNSVNFVKSQGGKLEVKSDGRNMGSTCQIFLPIKSKEQRDV